MLLFLKPLDKSCGTILFTFFLPFLEHTTEADGKVGEREGKDQNMTLAGFDPRSP